MYDGKFYVRVRDRVRVLRCLCCGYALSINKDKAMKTARICDYCGIRYFMNYANGSEPSHCHKPECIAAHRLESDARNRESSRVRMQMLRRMSAGVAV